MVTSRIHSYGLTSKVRGKKPTLYDIKSKNGNPTGKEHIVIPAFDLYSKEIGECSGPNRIATFAYERRISPENVTMLKKLFYYILYGKIKFILYDFDTIIQNKTKQNKTKRNNA